jgi:hypothetical protein
VYAFSARYGFHLVLPIAGMTRCFTTHPLDEGWIERAKE